MFLVLDRRLREREESEEIEGSVLEEERADSERDKLWRGLSFIMKSDSRRKLSGTPNLP